MRYVISKLIMPEASASFSTDITQLSMKTELSQVQFLKRKKEGKRANEIGREKEGGGREGRGRERER